MTSEQRRATSYIGITGFQTKEEVKKINEHVANIPVGYFMFGFTSSNKRLADPTSKGGTSPRLLDLHDLTLAVASESLPMIHYFSSNPPEQLGHEIACLFEYCRLDFSRVGLQINALWPLPKQIEKIRNISGPAFKITLQLPKTALLEDNQKIINHLYDYDGLIQYALIDPSGGTGADFDALRSGDLMLEMIHQLKSITPGVAGGFSCENVSNRIAELCWAAQCQECGHARLTDFCIDAQGKLREIHQIPVAFPPNSPPIEVGTLNLNKTINYIDGALEGFFTRTI